jgi:enoyl-CoA hydratase/carnithine racemase
MSEPQPMLLVEQDGPLLILTLNRPERLNALNRALQASLEAQYRRAERDPEIRAVIITGMGRAFCSGADLGHLQDQTGKSIEEQLLPPPKFTMRMAKVYKPTICAVNGICAGAGLHFVADSDIVIASDNASFVDTHVNVGQVTALEPIGLLQRVSLTKVLRMIILGKAERLSAAQALECEMISEALPAERLLARARELGQIAASVSPAAVQKSLRAIWNSLELPLARAYEEGFEALIRHRSHPDAKEGPAAFLGKRSPRWSPP